MPPAARGRGLLGGRTLRRSAAWLAVVLAAFGAPLLADEDLPPLEEGKPAPRVEQPEKPVVEKSEPARPGDLAKLMALIKSMNQRLGAASETVFYLGQRHLKVFQYNHSLYDTAEKWVNVYGAAVRRALKLPVADFLCAPERLLELKEAVEWGKLHAIAEPFYFKKGYKRIRPVLAPAEVPECLWRQSPPR